MAEQELTNQYYGQKRPGGTDIHVELNIFYDGV